MSIGHTEDSSSANSFIKTEDALGGLSISKMNSGRLPVNFKARHSKDEKSCRGTLTTLKQER